MRLAELTDRRVVLLGLGADVRAAVPAVLAARPAAVRVVEEDPTAAAELGLEVVSLEEAAGWGEVFLRSPGFPRYLPLLVTARERGARMTTPLDLWLGSEGHGDGRRVVLVTGTKGKSTVTSLVGALAERAGVRVGLAGNLGVPVFDEGWDAAAPVVVLEVSSYQAADLHHAAEVAVLTYLSEDHLSWHGRVETYVADKLRVLRNEGGAARLVLVPAVGGRAAAAVEAMGRGGGGEGAGSVSSVEVVAPPEGAGGDVPPHRLQNAALAARVLREIGGPTLSDAEIVDAARSSLPGRLDPCPPPPQRPGLLCLDDALASNPSAAAAGLAWVRSLGRPTVVLLGGDDRGVDPAPLVDEVRCWEPSMLCCVPLERNGVVLAERAGIALLGQEPGSPVGPVAGAVARSVEDAVTEACAWLPDDGVLLFSPGAPTPAGSGSWLTRSAAFRQTVRAVAAPA